MMEIDRAALEQHKTDLKLVLKTWEAQFRTDNGRRAGRDDIKANPGIGMDSVCCICVHMY